MAQLVDQDAKLGEIRLLGSLSDAPGLRESTVDCCWWFNLIDQRRYRNQSNRTKNQTALNRYRYQIGAILQQLWIQKGLIGSC